MEVRAMRSKRRKHTQKSNPWRKIAGIIGGVMIAIVAAAFLLQPWKLLPGADTAQEKPREAENPETAAESLSQDTTLGRGAILDQTLAYLPCGHAVQRRVEAPAELAGLDRKGIEKALPGYRVTAFSGKEVAMRRELNLFCPDHWVLMPDALGELCIWQNQLGEEMARLRGLGIAVEDLPESEQSAVRAGMGFASAEELEGWLEGVDG